jgi:hypothetical protein
MRPPLLPGPRKCLEEAATAYVEMTRGPDARHRRTSTLFYRHKPLGGSLLLAAHVMIQFQSTEELVWDGDAKGGYFNPFLVLLLQTDNEAVLRIWMLRFKGPRDPDS